MGICHGRPRRLTGQASGLAFLGEGRAPTPHRAGQKPVEPRTRRTEDAPPVAAAHPHPCQHLLVAATGLYPRKANLAWKESHRSQSHGPPAASYTGCGQQNLELDPQIPVLGHRALLPGLVQLEGSEDVVKVRTIDLTSGR